MKRSEIEKIIAEKIDYGCVHYGSSSGRFKVEIPKEILKALEKAGMLPPGGLEVASPYIIYYRPLGDIEKFETKADISLLWEPEDEKK